ncbi:uncharacterized oxidoreductase YoxD-like [Musca autumnalis]|uniref:uncharacterized oxidoreductase YoxD-like n=1 Tax=Musca autumnalis TaxID=221902 RepID=UPI003CEBDDCF
MNKQIWKIEAMYSVFVLIHFLLYPILVGAEILDQLKKWFTNGKRRSPHNLIGEVALITGSARGLGRDTAIALAKLGCHIAVVDVQEKLGEETARFIADEYNVKTKFYKIDVRDYQQLLELQKSITADLGVVTVLVNNAGILTMSTVRNPPAPEVQRMIDVNFTAPFLITEIFLPKMKELNRGYVVNISSICALYPNHIYNIYGATKAALRHLTASLNTDLLESNSEVRAIAVCPTLLTTNKRIIELVRILKLERVLYPIDGEVVAEYIVRAMLRGDAEITVPRILIWGYRLLATLPMSIIEMAINTSSKFTNIKNFESEASQILKSYDVQMKL